MVKVKPRSRNLSLCLSESCPPQFFKVFLPNRSSHRLQIPPKFVKYFNGDLPYKSTITSPEKRSWQVELNKVDDNWYFREGWQQYVQDNSLEFGDFLVFCYGGDAKFSVKIYGKNGCLKKFALPLENQTVERRKSKRLAGEAISEEITQKKLCPIVQVVIQEDDRTLKEADKFKSQFPFFKIVMTPSYVARGVMNMPSSFTTSYMEKDRQSLTLVASNKSWPVKLVNSAPSAWKFSQGWLTFSRENTLKAGDVCVFELTERDDFVLKVSVFRCPD